MKDYSRDIQAFVVKSIKMLVMIYNQKDTTLATTRSPGLKHLYISTLSFSVALTSSFLRRREKISQVFGG